MEAVLALNYKCRECSHDFGDPDAERSFETWAMLVKLHAFDRHGKVLRLEIEVNEALVAVWSYKNLLTGT